MTQAGQATLFHWFEDTPNQIPSPAPAGKKLRHISESLRVAPILADSPENTPGNEPQDQVVNGYEGGGDIQIAFSPRNYDDFLANLFWTDWEWQTGDASNSSIRDTGTAQVTYTAATRTLTTAGTWTNTPAAGDHILVQGSGNAYLDGIHRVDPASTPTSTAIVLEQDGILSNTDYVPNISSAKNITIIRGERVTNQLTPDRTSIGMERQIARTRGTFLGTTADGTTPTIDFTQILEFMTTRIQLQGAGNSPWTGSITGRASSQTDSSEADGSSSVLGSEVDYEDTPIFQGANSVKKCRFYFPDISATSGDPGKIEDTLRLCPESLSVELSNSLQSTELMCASTEFDHQPGEQIGQVTVVGIYETPYPLVAFNNQYAGVFELALVATNGDGYLVRFPRAKMTLASANIPGRAQTLKTNMTVKAYRQTDTPVTGDSARAIEVYRFQQP